MTIHEQAALVADRLRERNVKVVFAESCTGGRASAALTHFPGISSWHCGGVVVYRNETKTAWLDIPPATLENPGPVSEVVARQMAESVLKKTPEANIAVSVTGHLGPAAPPELDGHVFIGITRRNNGEETSSFVRFRQCRQSSRQERQSEAVEAVLNELARALNEW